MHKMKFFKCQVKRKVNRGWNVKTIEDVNDMHAGINDEDNRNKCDNEANKIHRKKEMGGINNDTRYACNKNIFSIEIPNNMA